MTEGIKTISINNKMKTVKQIESTKSITYSTMKTGSVAVLQQTPLIIRLCCWSGIAGTLNPVEPRLFTAHRTHLLSVWQNDHLLFLVVKSLRCALSAERCRPLRTKSKITNCRPGAVSRTEQSLLGKDVPWNHTLKWCFHRVSHDVVFTHTFRRITPVRKRLWLQNQLGC